MCVALAVARPLTRDVTLGPAEAGPNREWWLDLKLRAVDAAPYLHPRLSTVAVSGQDDAPLTIIHSGMTVQEAAEAYAGRNNLVTDRKSVV